AGAVVPCRPGPRTDVRKSDGVRVRILSVPVRRQVAGRAGRRGFHARGSVVAQAPEHVIENKRLEIKASADPKKKRKFVKKKPPERGYVPWDESTFNTLIASQPEPLVSQFTITHGLLLTLMKREIDPSARDGGYRRLVEIIARSYERDGAKRRLRRIAASQFRDLRAAGVIEVLPGACRGRAAVRVS